jgi:hypothetical protein
MSKIEKFEDIVAWQKARALTREVYAHTQQYITTAQFTHLYNEADEVGRFPSGFMGYLRQSDLKGRKFK